LLKLALDGIFTFSEVPLKMATLLGFIIALFAIVYGSILLIWRIVSDQDLPGFATLSIGMFFLGGIQLFCIGILGEYVGRIHNQVKGRPSFIIDSISGDRNA
jgi:dolichol-phosphate mannosyltransferase